MLVMEPEGAHFDKAHILQIPRCPGLLHFCSLTAAVVPTNIGVQRLSPARTDSSLASTSVFVSVGHRAANRCRGRVSARREGGFTLLEVIVALMLTSLVVMLAYSAAQVSFDAHSRLGTDLRILQGERAGRQLLADALRNAEPPQRPEDPGFALQDNRLSFVAAGGAPPLDPDYDWLISVGPTGDRIEVVAKPLGRAPPAEVRFTLPQVTRWEVQVPGGPTGWLREWPSGNVLPRAVQMTFWNDSAPIGSPLRVALVP